MQLFTNFDLQSKLGGIKVMMKRNYQKELEKTLTQIQKSGEVPQLFLHCCCAPCSSYVLEYLSDYFHITVFYYNPNITDKEEYGKRVAEVKRLIAEMPARHPIEFVEGEYEPKTFAAVAKGLEREPEGGARCEKCFRLRLAKTAEKARATIQGKVFISTTLTISPLKDAELLNSIGEEIVKQFDGMAFLNSDFKKNEGYKRSIELSRKYNLYRQNYCGCEFSRKGSLS